MSVLSGRGATTTKRGPLPPEAAPDADISFDRMALTSVSSCGDSVTGAGVVVVLVVLWVVVVVVVVVGGGVVVEDCV